MRAHNGAEDASQQGETKMTIGLGIKLHMPKCGCIWVEAWLFHRAWNFTIVRGNGYYCPIGGH